MFASMDISKFLCSFLLIQALVLVAPQTAVAQNSNLYSEYIGALFNGVKFTDVPINPNVHFHFILAFAIDYTSTPSPTNGKFNIFWDSTNLSPSAVSSIKQANGNVKVGLSLGGATVSGQNVVFTASSVDTWVSNAVSSLTPIIQQYHLDGIDVDYETFDSSAATVDTFVECIGHLITTLKESHVISFASIAPFDNADVQSHYQALWQKYSGVIDFVNFQFYAYSKDTTKAQFLDHYNQQLSNYHGGKILTSFISDGSGGLTPANGFFDACSTLQSENKLAGIFAWSADTSRNTGNGFQYEKQAQTLLANA